MQYYLAPMEGITGALYRKAYAECFGNIDKYFTPFLSPNQNLSLTHRDRREYEDHLSPARPLVPQILANKPERFLWLLHVLYEDGYREINLNLGCPSKTVTSRGRGSAFLGECYALKAFFETIYEDELLSSGKVLLSVKSRVGVDDEDEFPWILELFNAFPLSELIIHARTQKDFYGGTLRYEAYRLACEKAKMPVCYNGDVYTREDALRIQADFPRTKAIMIGRGILRDPGLMADICGGKLPGREELLDFHDRLCRYYKEGMSGEQNMLYRMKELWTYWGASFPGEEKMLKRIKKCTRPEEYEGLARELIGSLG